MGLPTLLQSTGLAVSHSTLTHLCSHPQPCCPNCPGSLPEEGALSVRPEMHSTSCKCAFTQHVYIHGATSRQLSREMCVLTEQWPMLVEYNLFPPMKAAWTGSRFGVQQAPFPLLRDSKQYYFRSITVYSVQVLPAACNTNSLKAQPLACVCPQGRTYR